MFTVSSTLIWAVLTGPADWVCHIETLTPCIEVVAQSCIIVTWWSGAGGIQALSERPTGFLQCFDIVGLVIWPVKIVSDMTYNVFGGTLNLAQSIIHADMNWPIYWYASVFVNSPVYWHQCKVSNAGAEGRWFAVQLQHTSLPQWRKYSSIDLLSLEDCRCGPWQLRCAAMSPT